MTTPDNTWNTVKRKGRRLRTIPTPANSAADSLEDGIRPNPKTELSADDLWRYHQTVTKDWQATELWNQVRKTLESASTKTAGSRPAITKAVCLGPGPYEPSNWSAKARRTAHLQTAGFCFLVEYLKTQSGQDIKCVVQEPRFTQQDREFCSRLGLEAVESPAGFEFVDEETLVFGIHMELEIYNLALKTLPAIFVGASLQEWERVVNDKPDTEGPLAAFSKMEATYDKYAFPDLEYMFSSTVMYWRRDEEIEK